MQNNGAFTNPSLLILVVLLKDEESMVAAFVENHFLLKRKGS